MPERKPFQVLILGASGVFGSRLAELASREQGIALTLAARNLGRLEEVAAGLPGKARCITLDRDQMTALDLSEFDLLIDAAGPFQASHMRVVESALAANVDYVDLADGRDFVREFSRFDEFAKGAEVALTTGASSIPALSHAVIDELTDGWQQIDHLRIGIYPGNRAPRGLSVVEAILSYVGKPVRVFREGHWQDVPGWGMTHREDIPGIGPRWASVCDTPEQDLLVERYAPKEGAEFFAGLELSLLHVGLAAFSLPVRWGWVKSLRPIAKPMLTMAQWFLPFGSDRGAMSIQARGIGADGKSVSRRWVLKADANRGPYVPVLAALAMIRRYRDGQTPEVGARACSGILALSDFEDDFARLGMEHDVFDAAGALIDFDSRETPRQSCAA
ncbi:saccharopine dehydrogenase NADP-binding domain-containing protein [uncultured Erythrobacter sp.]|uniref:saccharopine dehydrogenase family protein n=1 Tax=uncultured Erythrobacter sp. TaxID=263913 RepID=UPI00261E6435|nr:saccharopine dehydrogenase NADP-binding domain-containing protein [uncultured Erythrobacter sp.]